MRSTSVAVLGIGPRGQGGTIWLCFCLPTATYASTRSFAAPRKFASEKYPLSASTAVGFWPDCSLGRFPLEFLRNDETGTFSFDSFDSNKTTQT